MPELPFVEKERVLCFHGPLIYEAKVIEVEPEEEPHYFVHYKGWKGTWDEWVPDSRIMKLNDANKAKQKQLVESREAKSKSGDGNNTSKDAGNKRKAPEASSSRANKRGRDNASTNATPTIDTEEEWVKKPEIKLTVPDILKVQLVDDWEAITKNCQLVPLPRTPNVKTLLEDYQNQYKSTKISPDLMREVIAGLKLYFTKCLGNNLLYRFERGQYSEHQNDDVSEVYGAEHLLRLFVNLPELLAHTTMDNESLKVLREALHDILGWLERNHKKYLLSPLDTYENTSTSYQNLARA